MKSKKGATPSLERKLTRIAKALVKSRERGCITTRPSSLQQHFTLLEAYEVYRIINSMLIDKGYTPIGRKLGFTNPETWNEFDLSGPIWAFMYDKTIDLSTGPVINIQGLVAPRIEPEVVLKLNDKIEGYPENGADISQTVEWVAIGLEIVDSHYANWKFNAPDIVADFGAHSKLIVGNPIEPNRNQRMELDNLTKNISVQLFKNSHLIDIGRGENALGGPLRALEFLIEELNRLPWNASLKTGEIVTTGTLTKIPFIKDKEEWVVKVEGLNLSPVAIKTV